MRSWTTQILQFINAYVLEFDVSSFAGDAYNEINIFLAIIIAR